MEKNSLKKGDLVYFTNNGDNELIISAKNNDNVRVKLQEITITTDAKSQKDVNREIISAYLKNFHQITVVGSNLDKKVRDIRKCINNLVGLEIIEHTKDRIVAKDILNMKKISVLGTLKKIDAIVREMIEDSKHTLSRDAYDSILVRDEDVNRLTNLVFRISRYVLKKPHLLHSTGLTPFDFFKYFQVADNLEKIGDETKRLSRFLRKMEVAGDIHDELVTIYQRIHDSYTQAMECFYAHDVKAATERATRDAAIREACDTFMMKHKDIPLMDAVVEKLKQMHYHIHSIGREVYQ